MSALAGLVLLGDLDLLLREVEAAGSRQRLRKLGFVLDGVPRLMAARERLARGIERRWMVGYERARQRYGRGIAAVRDRVCLGCFVTLPTSAARPPADAGTPDVMGAPGLCASCGRILYWS
jgi:predicted  nucleic acid-binding Zn-ribbon protein